MSLEKNNSDIKTFLIKLVAISFAVIVIINVSFNLILGDKIDKINLILSLNEKENIEKIKDKVRLEINKGLEKDKILNKDDKELLIKFYNKLKKEFKDFETN